MPVGTTARRSISFVFHMPMSQSKADRQPETCQSDEKSQLFLAKALKNLSKQYDHLEGHIVLKRTMGPASRSFVMVWKNPMDTIQSPTSSACGELDIRNVVIAARDADGHKTLYFPFGALYYKVVFRWIWHDISKRGMRS